MKQIIYNDSNISLIKQKFSNMKKVVFTNGCFDILHVGHLRYLTEAKTLGDTLIVGLNSDISVKKLKGPNRPIVNETERAEMLLGLKVVDYVIIFSDKTPIKIIKAISPDVLVKGGDWNIKDIIGSDHVLSTGGKVKSLSFETGHSSTNIIKKIIKSRKLNEQ